MSDAYALEEPPAKRARYDEPSHGAIDVPSSPIDDMDDDFYESTPVKPSPLPATSAGSSLAAVPVAPGSTTSHSLALPGLGIPSSASPQPAASNQIQGAVEELEDGELSDSESLYNDSKQAPPMTIENENAATSAPPAQAAPIDGSVQTTKDSTEQNPTETVQPTADLEDGELESQPKQNDEDNKEAVIDTKAEFLRAGEANKGNAGAEWQLDSEASDSSGSSSDDSDDSSNNGEEDSDEGELLDPEEQVRRLMMEAMDDPATASKAKVKTLNEVVEEYKKPEIQISETTKITELGKVESIVDNLVLVKAKVSGDYRVLESGSALCLENRTIIGQVSETIGRVQEPRYSMGFSDPAEIQTLGIEKGTPVYYIDEHSTFVFTEPLKAQKFTDASNLHDEEANDVEFSDDEKEAESKRKQKEAKKARAEANRDPKDQTAQIPKNDIPAIPAPYQYQGGGLNYSDDDEDLGMYKPLARPDHFEHIVGAGAPLEDRSHVRRGGMRGGRGGWPDRGRGFRGRGAGGGGRGNQRGRFAGPPPERGGRQQEHARPQERGRHADRGKHPDPRNRNSQRENRSASSGSPNRQNHGRQPPQASPARRNKGKKRSRFTASPAPAPTSTAPANTNAYAQNTPLNTNSWSMPQTSPGTTASSTVAPPNPAAVPAGSYVNPAFYSQPAPVQDQQQQQNLAQWAQWLQLAAAMSQGQQQGQPQAQAQPQAPPPPPPQPQSHQQPQAQAITQSQYPPQYQYQYNAAPGSNTQQANNQGATPTLQDI